METVFKVITVLALIGCLSMGFVVVAATAQQQGASIFNSTNVTTTLTNATNATSTNATAGTNATNTTRIITNLTWRDTGDVQIMSPQNIQYQQTDPAFSKLAQLTSDCLDLYNTMTKSGIYRSAENIQKQDFCTDVIRQGIAQFCQSTDFATFDLSKCEEAKKMSERYVQVVEYLYG
jgi:hypothetical protein